MEELDIIIEPELEFTLKRCGDVVPYGITPEEKAKLAGIEENANNYIHPETHPSSILDVVDVVNGAANKFLNERGEMVAVATSSIGVTGSPLYASTANSDVAGYKSLVGTPQTSETEITLTAKSTNGIVWGDKYLSVPFTEAVTIPATAYGFDYWRKVSTTNGTSRKHLRMFIYRAGVETDISTPLASPDINETDFTERQISYIFPELALLAGDRIGIQEGFSTTHANNITLTYIVGDGRGWFMRLPLPLKHESLTDKNSEAAFQHIDTTTTKETLVPADMVAIKDSATGKVVLTSKSNFPTVDTVNLALSTKADKNDTLSNTADIRLLENVINSANINQETTATITGVDTVALPKTAANTGMKMQLFGASDETKNVLGTGRIRSVNSAGLVPSYLYFNGGQLRSNGLIKDEIRKGTNGYELVKRVGVGTLGAELITNAADREFSSSSGWLLGGASEISGGTLKINFSASLQESGKIFPSIKDITNSRYFLASFDLISLSNSTNLRFKAGISSKFYIIPTTKVGQRVYILFLGWGSYNAGWIANGSVTAEIDNFSIKEVTFASGGTPSITAAVGIDNLQVIGTTAIHCTAATQTITPIAHAGLLNSNSNGTAYFEPIIADAGVYGSNLSVQLTDYPIASFESIRKYANGTYTELNTATAVIASGGLSFTHPDLVSGDLVMFTYDYNKESIGRSMTLTHYDSRFVVKDTANANVYRITPKITNGVLTWTLTLV